MAWVGALTQSLVLTVVLIGLIIGLTHWTDYRLPIPETYTKVCIGVTVLMIVSWIIFGWVMAFK